MNIKFRIIWKDGTHTDIVGDFISNTLEREGYTIHQLKKMKKWEILQ
jgi:hypothetical protein